jgi:hypothetical protein
MEDGAVPLVVRRKGVEPEAALLHISNECVIPDKRDLV